jgi:hypothetical protein
MGWLINHSPKGLLEPLQPAALPKQRLLLQALPCELAVLAVVC